MPEAGDSACKRVANWCALGGWQKSCRIRLISNVVSDPDDLKSDHSRIAHGFYDRLCCAKSTESQYWLCTILGCVTLIRFAHHALKHKDELYVLMRVGSQTRIFELLITRK
jgi:hypothetical protein